LVTLGESWGGDPKDSTSSFSTVRYERRHQIPQKAHASSESDFLAGALRLGDETVSLNWDESAELSPFDEDIAAEAAVALASSASPTVTLSMGFSAAAGATDCVLIFDDSKTPPCFVLERVDRILTNLRPNEALERRVRPRQLDKPAVSLKQKLQKLHARSLKRKCTITQKPLRARTKAAALVRLFQQHLEETSRGSVVKSCQQAKEVRTKKRKRNGDHKGSTDTDKNNIGMT